MREEQDQTERSHVKHSDVFKKIKKYLIDKRLPKLLRFLGELKWVDIELFAIQSNIKSHFISVHFITKIFQHKVKKTQCIRLI